MTTLRKVLRVCQVKQCLFSFEGANLQEEKRICASVFAAGANDAKDPPVPIPNTEVKLGRAEDTWLETTRENR